MKTWRLKLCTTNGADVGVGRSLGRWLACLTGPALAIGGWVALQPWGAERWALVLLAFNYLWPAVDPDRRFLQDRIAGTLLVRDGRLRSAGVDPAGSTR